MTDAEIAHALHLVFDNLEKPKLSNKSQQVPMQEYMRLHSTLKKVIDALEARDEFIPGTMMF